MPPLLYSETLNASLKVSMSSSKLESFLLFELLAARCIDRAKSGFRVAMLVHDCWSVAKLGVA